MSSATQPRKKKAAVPGGQEGKKSCHQHTSSISTCPECRTQQSPKAKIIDFPAEKKKSVDLIQKINDILEKDPKTIEKAAHVINSWISKNETPSKKKK